MEPVADRIYFRGVDPDASDSLSKIARRIAPGSAVLDLGCGPGALHSRLAADKRCVLDGVEGNAAAAALAGAHYRRVVVADLETEPLAAHFAGQRYDYIVCADVLEHLRRPEDLVAQLPALLAPSGRLLWSIPNIAYAGVIGALINGQFEYRKEGLLDATHLRFFTRASLLDFLARAGMSATRIDTVVMPIDRSEFARAHLDALPPAVLRTLLAQPDALTYQFIVEVAPQGSAAPPEVVAPPAPGASFSFVAQLFHRGAQPFDEAHCHTVHGAMGVERQRLSFPIPPTPDLAALRLDPTNRPGYLRLFGLSLFAANGDCIWRWDPRQPLDPLRRHQLRFVRDDQDGDSTLAVIEGDDGWFELPLPAEVLSRLRAGGTLELEASWPLSPDSHLVLERLLGRDQRPGRVAELARLNDDMRAHIRTLLHEIAELQQQLRAARATLSAINESLTFRLGRPLHAIVNRLRRR